MSQQARTGVGGGASRQDVINHNHAFACQFPCPAAKSKSPPDVFAALSSRESRLTACIDCPLEQSGFQRYICRTAEGATQHFGLVELSLSLTPGMQRNRDYHVPLARFDLRTGDGHKNFGNKGFDPKRILVLVAMQYVEKDAVRGGGRAGMRKVQLEVATIPALELPGNLTREHRPAALAEGWLD